MYKFSGNVYIKGCGKPLPTYDEIDGLMKNFV